MTEDRFCGTCARYQNGVACKLVEPIKDPKEEVFGCKNWTDKPEDIESNPVARGPIITDCLPGSPSVCVNCARYNPADGYCRLRSVRVYPAESTTCMNWLQQDTLLEICKMQHEQFRPKQTTQSEASVSASADTNKVCKTCGYFDPDMNECWFEEHDMSEEELMTRTCKSWEPRKEKLNVFSVRETIGMDPVNPVKVPLQPDGSLKFRANETIGITISNLDNVTRATLKEDTGWDHRLEAKALDRGAKQGITLEALDTVFAIACQQVPSMEKRWMELKAEINIMFAQKWATEDMPS